MVLVVQAFTDIGEICKGLVVAVSLLEPAGTEQDAVEAQAVQLVLIGNGLTLVQVFPGRAVYLLVDGVVPAVFVDVEGADDVAGFGLLFCRFDLAGYVQGLLRVLQAFVVAAGLGGNLGIGAELGLGDEDGGELFPEAFLAGDSLCLKRFLPRIGIPAGHYADAHHRAQRLHLLEPVALSP